MAFQVGEKRPRARAAAWAPSVGAASGAAYAAFLGTGEKRVHRLPITEMPRWPVTLIVPPSIPAPAVYADWLPPPLPAPMLVDKKEEEREVDDLYGGWHTLTTVQTAGRA
jgi:hypothetical protein